VIWMEQGRIIADGTPADVLEQYLGHPVRPQAHADQATAA